MDWSPHRKQTRSDDSRAATPVVGTVLLLGVVVVVSATVGVTVMDYPSEVEPTSVSVDDEQCQAVEFDPEDVEAFADDRSDCTTGAAAADAAASGPYRGAVMWFDASQEEFSPGGESVDRWTDRSGNGYDAIARGDPQGYADVDGVPAVTFDAPGLPNVGGDSFAPRADTDDVGLDGNSEFTVVTVVRPETGIQGRYFAVGDNSRGGFAGQVTSFGRDKWSVANSTRNETGGVDTTITTTTLPGTFQTWNVVTYTYNGSGMSFYINGALREQHKYDDIELETHGNISVGGSASGGLFEFNGAIAEFVVYDRAIDDDQRERLECGFDETYDSAVSVAGC